MGLAAAKNRQKIGKDPNNTTWARDTTTFGQRILRSHGWQPGSYLGPTDSAHSAHHTDANAAPIKVTLKGDNLGLGAKQRPVDECTGLDVFQDLLGRLNGKDESELEKRRQAREKAKIGRYVEHRLGSMRFVKGGWLVGDLVKVGAGLEEIPEEEDKGEGEESKASSEAAGDNEQRVQRKKERRVKKAKKRRGETTEDEVSEEFAGERKKKKRRKDVESESPEEATSSAHGSKILEEDKTRSSKKGKRRKEKKTEIEAASSGPSNAEVDVRKSKKDKKRKSKEEAATGPAEAEAEDSSRAAPSTSKSTPAGSGTSTPLHTRHLARSRNIAQKRLAFMDTQALNQIFMIKS